MFYRFRIIYKQYILCRVYDRLILTISFSLLLVGGHKAFFDLILKFLFTFVIKWFEKTTDWSWFGYYGSSRSFMLKCFFFENPIYYWLKTCKKFLYFLSSLLILVDFVKFVGAENWNWIPIVICTCAWTINSICIDIRVYVVYISLHMRLSVWLYTRLVCDTAFMKKGLEYTSIYRFCIRNIFAGGSEDFAALRGSVSLSAS